MTLVNRIYGEMSDDDCDQSDRLKRTFEAATPEQRAVVDDVFICLCGYSLTTMIARGDTFVIKDARGWFYTGATLHDGSAQFSPDPDDAVELDDREKEAELKLAYMPRNVTVEVIY